MDFSFELDFFFFSWWDQFDSSFSDDELELTLAIAIEELNNKKELTLHHGSI